MTRFIEFFSKKIPLFLFLGVFLLGTVLVSHIGFTWDDPDNIFTGGVYVNYFARGQDTSVFDTWNPHSSYFQKIIFPLDRTLSHLPPVHNYLGSFFVLLAERFGMPLTEDLTRVSFHLSAVFFFALLVSFVYMFARLFSFSKPMSLFAAISVLLYPTLFGHGFSNTKDIAQASLFTISMYVLVYGWIKHKVSSIILGAVVLGLGLGTKFNAIYVPVIWVSWILLESILQSKQKRAPLRYISLVIGIVVTVSLATVIIIWPYLWTDTVSHIQEVIRYFTTVGTGYKILWDGNIYYVGAGVSRWWYPLGSFLYQTPIPYLVLLLIGVGGVVRHPRHGSLLRLLAIWIAVPLFRIFLPTAAYYDQLRHFVEIIPAVALFGAYSLWWMGCQFTSKKVLVPIVFGAVIIIQMAYINVLYFPYSTGYYNELAIDPNTNFDRDVEALSVKEGMDYLHSTYSHMRVWSPIGGHLAWLSIKPGDKYVYTPEEADSIILINKRVQMNSEEFYKTISSTYRVDHVIQRGNAILGWVYRKISN